MFSFIEWDTHSLVFSLRDAVLLILLIRNCRRRSSQSTYADAHAHAIFFRSVLTRGLRPAAVLIFAAFLHLLPLGRFFDPTHVFSGIARSSRKRSWVQMQSVSLFSPRKSSRNTLRGRSMTEVSHIYCCCNENPYYDNTIFVEGIDGQRQTDGWRSRTPHRKLCHFKPLPSLNTSILSCNFN